MTGILTLGLLLHIQPGIVLSFYTETVIFTGERVSMLIRHVGGYRLRTEQRTVFDYAFPTISLQPISDPVLYDQVSQW